jgi:hypothetical protein
VIELIPARWGSVFEHFVSHIRQYGLFASPYVSASPVQRIAQLLEGRDVRLEILTNLESVWRGATDPAALVFLMDKIPSTRVWYLPRLHAKVYIADEKEAIVTSSNLTEYGLEVNYEYGVRISDPRIVQSIRDDLLEYRNLGNLVSREYLEQLARIATELQELRRQMEHRAESALRSEFQRRMDEAQVHRMEIRAEGKTTNRIFADTIVYLLKKYGPLTTDQMHPLIQQIHPDLCDDTIDRVIKGVRFGKLWKHYVRNAQQTLKRQRVISFDGHRWYLTTQ